jgi:hypothetical protein
VKDVEHAIDTYNNKIAAKEIELTKDVANLLASGTAHNV